MSTFTVTESSTFTYTHAKYIASKVAADLKRMQRFYKVPNDVSIHQYEQELTELLKHGYLDKVTYGFKKNSKWIEPTVQYTSQELAYNQGLDDDPGKIRPGADVSTASFGSFLEYSSKWDSLSAEEQIRFKKSMPFIRGEAAVPLIDGYLDTDKSYSAGGKTIKRATVRSLH